MDDFDELIRTGRDAEALRMFAAEYYRAGKMGYTRKNLLERAADNLEALQKELATLAIESIRRETALARLEAEVAAVLSDANRVDAQRWIPVTERLPENERRVLIRATRKFSDGRVLQIRSMAMYEDGSMPTGKSGYMWEDCDFPYSNEFDEYLVPQGWWEQPEYSETFCAVDDTVTHWMPLPVFEES